MSTSVSSLTDHARLFTMIWYQADAAFKVVKQCSERLMSSLHNGSGCREMELSEEERLYHEEKTRAEAKEAEVQRVRDEKMQREVERDLERQQQRIRELERQREQIREAERRRERDRQWGWERQREQAGREWRSERQQNWSYPHSRMGESAGEGRRRL